MTLERYVQESVFVQCCQRLSPRVQDTLRRLAELSGQLIAHLPESELILERVDARPRDDSSTDEESD